MTITSRMPRAEYDAIPAINISRIKHMKRSPLHYKDAIDNPKTSDPMTLGLATHVAVLEPEKFAEQFCVWNRKSDAGNSCPRKGQYWEQFVKEAGKRTILTENEFALANAIAKAVRFHEGANKYLATGDAEVTLEWVLDDALGARPAKSRVDWMTHLDGHPYLVGLKTTHDCRHFQFGRHAANLGYHLAWAFYADAYKYNKGIEPRQVEIVVETKPPYDVAVYRIEGDLILQGREEYWECVKRIAECEASGIWPGSVPVEEALTLPTWAYQQDGDDISDLGLEGAED